MASKKKATRKQETEEDGSVDIKATKIFPSCGVMDHQRNSSRLCKAKKKIPPSSEEGISQQQKKIDSKSKEGRSN
eukprot:14684461-Ditylum_brightwellii.AAC.1